MRTNEEENEEEEDAEMERQAGQEGKLGGARGGLNRDGRIPHWGLCERASRTRRRAGCCLPHLLSLTDAAQCSSTAHCVCLCVCVLAVPNCSQKQQPGSEATVHHVT